MAKRTPTLMIQVDDPALEKILVSASEQIGLEKVKIINKNQSIKDISGGQKTKIITQSKHTARGGHNDVLLIDSNGLSIPMRFEGWVAMVGDFLTRRVHGGESVRVGGWRFFPHQRVLKSVSSGKTPIRLTEKESAILAFFIDHPNRDLSPEQLLRGIWHYHPDVTSHTVQTHIYKLRQKIERNPAAPRLLCTTAKGYRLILKKEED